MKYPQIVRQARKMAVNEPIIVYETTKGLFNWRLFGWATVPGYEHLLRTSKRPVIKLLLCMPNGTIAQ